MSCLQRFVRRCYFFKMSEPGPDSIMNNSTSEELKTDCREGPADNVLSDNEIDGEEDDDDVGTVCVRDSSFEDFSDNEISTQKEFHWRLGPADLNDTLIYDFPEFQAELEKGANEEAVHNLT